ACPINDQTYQVLVTDANGCQGTDNFFVNVNPLPNISLEDPITLCNQPVAEQLDATPVAGPDETGVWSGTDITPEGQFTPTGLGQVNVTYTFTDLNGCTNSQSTTVDVVDPINADGGEDQFVCASTTDYQMTPVTPGGIWSSADVTITNGGLVEVDTPGTYTLQYELGGGSCLSLDEVLITVYELPSVDVGTDLAICDGESVQLDAIVTEGSGTVVNQTWSPAGLVVDPALTSTSGQPSLDTVFSFTVTDDNNCEATDDVLVQVLQTPIVDAGPDVLVCNQPIAEDISGNAFPVDGTDGGVGTWTGNNIDVAGSYTPSGITTEYVYYTFENIAGCSATDSLLVTVSDPVHADAGPDFGVCLNDLDTQLAQPGTWSGDYVTPEGLFSAAEAGDWTLTLSLGNGSCETTDEVIATVYTLPVADAGTDETICEGLEVQLGVTATGDNLPITGYSWSGGDGLSSTVVADPIASPVTTQTYSVTVVDSNGCSDNDQVTVNVNAAPEVEAGPDITVCNQVIPETLMDFSPVDPINGVWTGDGITNPEGEFTPFSEGTFTVYYTFTSGIGCDATDSLAVTVIAPQIAEAGPDLTLCLNNGGFTLQDFQPLTDITWDGPGIVDPLTGTYDPQLAGVGTHEVTISFGEGSCFSEDSRFIEILPLPVIDVGLDDAFCGNLLVQNLDAFSPAGGTWEGPGIVDASLGTVDPSIGTGSYDIFYWYEDQMTGCADTLNQVLTIHPVPEAIFDLEPLGCTNAPVDYQNNSTGGVDFEWDWDDGEMDFVENPIYIYNTEGFFDVTMIAFNEFGCSDTTLQSHEIINTPAADFTLIPEEGCAPLEVAFQNNSVGQDLTYEWNLAIDSSIDFEPASLTYSQGDAIVEYNIILEATNFCGSDFHTDT
ncbi:MAG: hypothetical protein HRT74_11060, partial [Flavobacteriales bacterium]|nr:hypothetical protein [Flavobacteriales bacterium]